MKKSPRDQAVDRHQISVTRRQLVPIWLKVLCWLCVIGLIIPVYSLSVGLVRGIEDDASIYGLDFSGTPLSASMLTLDFLLVIQGVAAIGLLRGAPWGVSMALMAATVVLIASAYGTYLNGYMVRVELVIAALVLLKVYRMRGQWMQARSRKVA